MYDPLRALRVLQVHGEAAGRHKEQAHLHVLSDLRTALREAEGPPTA